MATVQSSRTCLPKLCCSIVAIRLFTAGILITGAYPHPNLNNHHYKQTNSSANETNLTTTGNATLAAKRLAFIQASNEALYAHLDEALARINKNRQQNKELANRISRSPRAIKTIQALEAAIAMFEQNQPEPEYQISEYATGNKRWRRAPSVHPVPKDPIMALVTRTVATYMFITRSNNGKTNPGMEDFSSGEQPFFKKKE
jgi:(p)ppGpp synthase/HD superfamily hydrolase